MAGGLTIASAPAQAKRLAAMGTSLASNPKGRRAVLAALTVLTILAAAWAMSALIPQASRAVAPGMAEADKIAALELLRTGGFKPEIDRDSGEIRVADADYHRARMALAAGGLPKAVPGGYAVLDNLPLGISRSVEAARLRQSAETDLAATIGAITGVERAQVHLVEAQDGPFIRDGAKASAAVFLKLAGGRALDDGQTEAIVHLVSASVPGLAADRVSVVDQTGRLLTARTNAGPDLGRDQLDYAAELELRIRNRITALLVPLAGPGNFSAEATADIDFARVQSTRERVDPGNTVVASEQGQASSTPPPPPAAGIPGVLSNIVPANSQAVSTLPQPRPASETLRDRPYTRTFAVGRTIEVVDPGAGALRKLSVGIVLREAAGLSQKDIPRITTLVRDAIGADPRRGDRVSVIVAPFVEPALPAEPWMSGDMLQTGARIAIPLIAALILTFGLGRPLMARAVEARATSFAEPPVRLISAVEQQEKIEAVRVFVRDNPSGASRALRQLVQSGP